MLRAAAVIIALGLSMPPLPAHADLPVSCMGIQTGGSNKPRDECEGYQQLWQVC